MRRIACSGVVMSLRFFFPRFYSLEVTSKRERKEKKDLRENENNVGRRKIIYANSRTVEGLGSNQTLR